jgi:hypothetical protein
MRGLWIFLFATLSAIALLILFVAWFSWGMADFDCADGYIECRHPWFSEFGILVAVTTLLWTAAAIWLFKTRKKS